MCFSYYGRDESDENNEHEGVIGSVTMTLTAILTCLLGPLFAMMFIIEEKREQPYSSRFSIEFMLQLQ